MAVSDAEKYGYGTLATFIVSILGFLGIVVLPCFKKKIYNYILISLTGLAIGTLFCDTMLHILPEILGVEEATTTEITVSNSVIRSCIVVACLYLFWLFEVLIQKFFGHAVHSHSHTHAMQEVGVSDVDTNSQELGVNSKKPLSAKSNNPARPLSSKVHPIPETLPQPKEKCFDIKKIKPTAWMLIASDFLHNLCDGLAMGASFAESLSLGLATTIAVVCHEIPHEIADYAVYVQCGFKHWQSLLINFGTTITCFIGFYIGASVATDEEVSRWILSITAGMFLYIALVDLLPNVMNTLEWNWKLFIVVNILMWVGWLIMFLLAVFESQIVI